MSAAVLSDCGMYRYLLTRKIDAVIGNQTPKPCLFVMLNPSTADATKDDPTIRRCVRFARREFCNSLTVVNLFAYRSTDPDGLRRVQNPFGPDNERHIYEQLKAHRDGMIVAAWGVNQMADKLVTIQHDIACAGAHCLGITKHGYPRHPVRLRADQPLIPWKPSC